MVLIVTTAICSLCLSVFIFYVIFSAPIMLTITVSAGLSIAATVACIIHQRNQKRRLEAAAFIRAESTRQSGHFRSSKHQYRTDIDDNSKVLVGHLAVMGFAPDEWDGKKRTLKKRYHRLASKLHADKHHTDSSSSQTFIDINTAYEAILKIHGWRRAR